MKNYFTILTIIISFQAHTDFSLSAQKDYPFSILHVDAVKDNGDFLKRDKAKELQSIKNLFDKQLKNSFSALLKAITSQKQTKDIILKLSNKITLNLKPALKKIEGQFVEEAVLLQTLLVPWSELNLMKENLKGEIGVSGYKLNNYKVNIESDFGGVLPFYGDVYTGIMKQSDFNFTNKDKSAFHFVGLQIQLRIKKNDSQVKIQIVGQMSPGSNAVEVVNPQVEINKITIPNMSETKKIDRLSVVLMELNSSFKEDAVPLVDIDFGNIIKFQSGSSKSVGEFILVGGRLVKNICQKKIGVVPYLEGTLSVNVVDNRVVSWIAKNRKVNFHLLSLQLDALTKKVNKIDVRVDIPSIPKARCLSLDQVNEKFGKNISDMIQEKLDSIFKKQDDLTDELLDNLYAD